MNFGGLGSSLEGINSVIVDQPTVQLEETIPSDEVGVTDDFVCASLIKSDTLPDLHIERRKTVDRLSKHAPRSASSIQFDDSKPTVRKHKTSKTSRMKRCSSSRSCTRIAKKEQETIVYEPISTQGQNHMLDATLRVRRDKSAQNGSNYHSIKVGETKQELLQAMRSASLEPSASTPLKSTSFKGYLVVNNGAVPPGFSAKDYIVRAGNFAGLIAHLTNQEYCDVQFRDVFLLTYRSFARESQLLSALREKFNAQTFSDFGVDPIQLRVFSSVKAWLSSFWEIDFAHNEQLRGELNEFITSLEEIPLWRKRAEQLRGWIAHKLELKDNTQFQMAQTFPEPYLPTAPLHEKYIDIKTVRMEEVARQLAIYNSCMFVAIKPSEFMDMAWKHKDKEQRAPHILKMIDHFNRVSKWAIGNIVITTELAERVKIVRWFISLADELVKLNDINTALALKAALDSADVGRLKRTWELIGDEHIAVLKRIAQITDTEDNYKNLRRHIKECPMPVVPYIGLYLRDLTFIEDGNPVMTNGLINMNKCFQTGAILQTLREYQKIGFNLVFQSLPSMQHWITNLTHDDEDTLFQQSLMIEPRKGPMESYQELLETYLKSCLTEEYPPVPISV